MGWDYSKRFKEVLRSRVVEIMGLLTALVCFGDRMKRVMVVGRGRR